MRSKKSFFIVYIWGIILLVTSACLSGPPTEPAPPPTQCPQPTPNIYSMPPLITSNYVDWSRFTQQQALDLLTGMVERWSDYEDIRLDENTTYRIAVTVVTPDLRRAVFIMEAIHRQRPQDIAGWMTALDEQQPDRDYLRLLVTVSANRSGAVLGEARDKIAIAPNSLTMFDRHGQDAKFSSSEGAFLTAFNVANGPYAAYITYPLMNEKCELNLDVMSDTSITLVLRGLKIGDNSVPDISWAINLSPLIRVGLPTLIPSQSTSSGGAIIYLAPKLIPPTPNPDDHSAMIMDNYWIDMAKFIWSKLSASNSR